MTDTLESVRKWLLLIHQVPPKPDYLRVKFRRRLQRLGAVPLKRTVYALPTGDQCREDFEWLARDIVAAGGDATVCEAAFFDAQTDQRLVDANRATCAEEYRALATASSRTTGDLHRLTTRFHEVTSLDLFGADGREDARAALDALAGRLAQPGTTMTPAPSPEKPNGRVWVTRATIYVDRIASAWLIRRFIDPAAQFRFVVPTDYQHQPGERRFDMYDGEFTHDGDLCTFETLCRHYSLTDPALSAIGEIVHDIDCKDDKFARSETAGVHVVLDGIVEANTPDVDRLARGAALFDDLYTQFRKGRT